MLLHEAKSISEISAAVGYKSQSKFTSAFRDIFQILPTAYQKLYRIALRMQSSHSQSTTPVSFPFRSLHMVAPEYS